MHLYKCAMVWGIVKGNTEGIRESVNAFACRPTPAYPPPAFEIVSGAFPILHNQEEAVAPATLPLDKGGRLVTVDELGAIPCPIAPAGSRWRPVPHHVVLEQA